MTIAQSSLDPKNSTFPTSSGDGYELQMGRHSRSLAPLFIEFAAARAGGKALDVGCGTGNLAVELSNSSAFTSIEAFDFSPAYITYAKARGVDPRINSKRPMHALFRSLTALSISHSRCWCLRLSRSRNAQCVKWCA
jgi:SAM-dependent methyltransferase